VTTKTKKKTDPMRVLVCEPGKAPEVRIIPPTLKAWQAIVGGFVEELFVGGRFSLFCNEDGISLQLPLNRVVDGIPVLGPFFVAKDGRRGEIIGLDEVDVPVVLQMLMLLAPESEAQRQGARS